MYPQMASCSS